MVDPTIKHLFLKPESPRLYHFYQKNSLKHGNVDYQRLVHDYWFYPEQRFEKQIQKIR
jgi:hypothetical protein